MAAFCRKPLRLDDGRAGRGAGNKNSRFDGGLFFVIGGDFFGNCVNGVGLHQRDTATAKTTTGHAATVNAAVDTDGFGNFHHGIEFRAAHLVIIPNRPRPVPPGPQPLVYDLETHKISKRFLKELSHAPRAMAERLNHAATKKIVKTTMKIMKTKMKYRYGGPAAGQIPNRIIQWLTLLAFATLVLQSSTCMAQGTASLTNWTQTSAPNKYWESIACSADGTKLAALASGGGIYTSTNSGVTWTQSSVTANQAWVVIASSADGTKLAAALENNGIYTSTNSGVTWTQRLSGWGEWASIASSADGTKLAATASIYLNGYGYPGGIITSTNSGVTWIQTSALATNWYGIASSADGTKLAAGFQGVGGGDIYTSTNSGVSWTQTSAPLKLWQAIASSADGTKLVAAAFNGGIYSSADSGATWTQTSAPNTNYWHSITSSADGTRLAAVAGFQKQIYTSTDSGVTWTLNSAPNTNYWLSITSSADGTKLAAAVSGGGIWILQTTPTPVMNITPTNGNFTLSWIVPSTNFIVQRCSDLWNWQDMTDTPVLNLSGLQEEMTLSPNGSNSFFRLKTP